jgi:ribonuclease HII
LKTIYLKPFLQNGRLEAGCDEAGRGCLAGAVYAAAVILPADFYHPLLNDSKQISEKQRYELRPYIEENAVAYAVAWIDNTEIDKINILNASILAMHRALDKLNTAPDFILIDGNRFKPYKGISYQCIVKGDASYASIAAASVLAKTYRDDYMKELAAEYPYYDWEHNKGYPTRKHRAAIAKYGVTPYHRTSYKLLDEQLELF